MTRSLSFLCGAAVCVSSASIAFGEEGARTVLSGEVRALDAQAIIVPPSVSASVSLRFYVPEGQPVKTGDVLLRIDTGEAETGLHRLATEIQRAEAKTANEVAELRVKANEADLAVATAQAAYEVAALDAGVPRKLLSGLDADRYANKFEYTRSELEFAKRALANAQQAVDERIKDGVLETERNEKQREYNATQVKAAEVRATHDGIVLHDFGMGDKSGRIDEGSTALVGQQVGSVVSPGAVSVRLYVLASDRARIDTGTELVLAFDAMPGRTAKASVKAISDSPEPRPVWGAGRYFVVDAALAPGFELPLIPGMSVRAEVAPKKE
jgi:multidrug resistance efflux pump